MGRRGGERPPPGAAKIRHASSRAGRWPPWTPGSSPAFFARLDRFTQHRQRQALRRLMDDRMADASEYVALTSSKPLLDRGRGHACPACEGPPAPSAPLEAVT
jgi:hypothetical protein